MTNDIAIELVHLNKRYGTRDVIFSDVNISFPSGQIIGLIGENGSGKTTFIKLISGMAQQDSGEIYVLGEPLTNEKGVLDLRDRISILGDANRALYWNISGMDNIEYFWTLKTGRSSKEIPSRIFTYLERFNMNDFIHKKVETYSKGMKQRLLLLISLLNEPKILFMDEPLNGLDFENAFILKRIIAEFANELNGTVIITSHDKNFINEVCDSQYLIHNKQISECDTFSRLNKEITLYVKFNNVSDAQFYIETTYASHCAIDDNILKMVFNINDAELYHKLSEDIIAGKLQVMEAR